MNLCGAGVPPALIVMEFVDPRTTPFVRPKCRGELPHLYKPGCTYFVTFRLFDAVIPSPNRIDDLAQYGIEIDDDPDALLRDYDPPITLGSCLLGRPEAAETVNGALSHFDGDRYELISWCVMPNHVHVIFTPGISYTCDKILHSWKSFTAHAINRALHRIGRVWERESFDHLVRSPAALERFVAYTQMNPVKAGLCTSPDEWPYTGVKCSLGQRAKAGGTPAPQRFKR